MQKFQQAAMAKRAWFEPEAECTEHRGFFAPCFMCTAWAFAAEHASQQTG